MIWAPSGGIGSAYRNQTGMFSPENQAKMKEAAAAQYKSYTENQARIQAEGLAKMEREREALRSYRPAAGAARYYDPDSTNYVNPYYVGPDPSPGKYKRFHWESPGSGIQYLKGSDLASSVKTLIESMNVNEADVSGLSPMMLRSAEMGGGFGYLPYSQAVERGLISDEVQANLAYNENLRKQQAQYKSFFDQEALDYFKAGGIDVAGIKTTEDLEAIPTALKGRLVGDMLDIRARRAQAKNQRPKPFGFGDALGIGLTAASMFVPNPWAAGALAASGSAAGGGDLGDIALAGGLAGLGNWAGGKFNEYMATGHAGTAGTGAGQVGSAASSGITTPTGAGGFTTAQGAGLGATTAQATGYLPNYVGSTSPYVGRAALTLAGSGGAGIGYSPLAVLGGAAAANPTISGLASTLGSYQGGRIPVGQVTPLRGNQILGTGNAGVTSPGISISGIGSLAKDVGLDVAGILIDPTIRAVGQDLFAESPPTPQDDSSSDSRGGTLSGVINRMAQGMGSLPQTTPSFVDPTPYLGVADLNPAFMNQFELGNAASPSGVTSLDPAFMNQLERAELGLA